MLSFDESVIVAAILFIFVTTQEIFDDRRYAGTARASSA